MPTLEHGVLILDVKVGFFFGLYGYEIDGKNYGMPRMDCPGR